jgi:hypothetical protein
MSNNTDGGLRIWVVLLAAVGVTLALWLVWPSKDTQNPSADDAVSGTITREVVGNGDPAPDRFPGGPPKAGADLPQVAMIDDSDALANTMPEVQSGSLPGRQENLVEADRQQTEQLLAQLPMLNESAQDEAVQQLALVSDDAQFMTLAPLLTNPQSSPGVQDALFTELFNRPEEVKLPLCLAVAQVEGHLHQEEALTVLRLYGEEDYGTNWAAWQGMIETRLKERPPE